MSDEAIAELEAHSWPGNVRELINVVERLANKYDDEVLGAEAVRAELGRSSSPRTAVDYSKPLAQRLREHEISLVQQVLVDAHGNASKAAALAQMPYQTFYSRVRELGLQAHMRRRRTPRAAAHQQSILIIDDQKQALDALRRRLSSQFDVTTALGADAAFQILTREREFAMVICDMIMPHVDGLQVFEKVNAAWPELTSRFFIATGHPELKVHLPRGLKNPLLPKPLDIAALTALLSSSQR